MKYRDVLDSYTERKKLSDFNSHFFLFYLYRPLSFVFTYLFVSLRIRTNAITFLTFFFGPALIFSDIFLNTNSALISFTSSFFFYLFDCVDGNMARIYKQENSKGEFFDSFSGILYSLFVYLFFSLKVQNHNFWIQVIPLFSFGLLMISRYLSLRYLIKKEENKRQKISIKILLKSIPDLIPFFIFFSYYGYALHCVIFLGLYNLFGLIYIVRKILYTN